MAANSDNSSLRIAVVGPCASGKSTLATALKATGYEVRMPVQEHSHVLDMWRRKKPDVLIYLDVDYEYVLARRPHNAGSPARLVEQYERLAHARAHCDLYVDTNGREAGEVQKEALGFLKGASASLYNEQKYETD